MLANIGKPLVYPQLYLYLLTFSVLILPLCLCTTDNKDADLDSTFPLDEFVRRDLPRANSAPVLANGSQIVRRPSLGQQDPQVLPPVPIIPISEEYISNAQGNDTDAQDPASSRLRSRNIIPDRERWTSNSRQILKRDAESCGGGTQCADGSADGKCGFGPDYCGSGCQSNCDAAAMCGKYSLGGSQKCGMNLCCSTYGWCGTDDAHCSPTGDTPCQQGFGRCDDHVPPPSCSGTSTNTRTIGYYQVANTRSRLCNRISPEQIDTKGYTHLYLAFAAIDPKSFAVVPSDNPDATKSADAKQYSKFTALKSSTLQTWIAIGGFDFSDVGPTHTTWSDMVSTSANRAAFISSLKGFMAKYGFQGVDIDWEYPGTPDRGGKLGDTQNLVSLVKEMSASFNGQYGISLTLAPDYWYLRYFDPKAMEPYVNWFGFMAYDLHGSWDADVHTLGSIVRGQADVREIQNDTLPFWFDNLDPSKINLGLAAYGRGYTLSNPSCHTLECPFDGPNDPGECTNTAGIMSLVEIKNLVKEEGLTEHLLSSSMMKEISWGNQWIGYDDHDTWALKKKWANGLCFGGTMVWSVDMDSGQGR
ncbi:MAG: hypothetical protein M1820_007834 [Bogoriella megaspora]|nr:MAG: hypothetical protein M1820_007834 [Bogoriella megaspora]